MQLQGVRGPSAATSEAPGLQAAPAGRRVPRVQCWRREPVLAQPRQDQRKGGASGRQSWACQRRGMRKAPRLGVPSLVTHRPVSQRCSVQERLQHPAPKRRRPSELLRGLLAPAALLPEGPWGSASHSPPPSVQGWPQFQQAHVADPQPPPGSGCRCCNCHDCCCAGCSCCRIGRLQWHCATHVAKGPSSELPVLCPALWQQVRPRHRAGCVVCWSRAAAARMCTGRRQCAAH